MAAESHCSGDAYLNLSCPVCGCMPVPHFKHDRYFSDRCPDCDFVYVRNVPSEATQAAYTGNTDVSAPATQQRWSRRIKNLWHAKNIANYGQERRRLLEMDGGQDHLIDLRYPDEFFDFVVGIYVLDRVHHLGEFICKVKGVLSAEGRVYFRVTHFSASSAEIDWHYFTPPQRLRYFSVTAPQHIVTYHGFRIPFAPSFFASSAHRGAGRSPTTEIFPRGFHERHDARIRFDQRPTPSGLLDGN